MKSKILQLCLSLFCIQTAVYSQVKLNSYPSASATIYLDFDGEFVSSPVWNNGHDLNCAASGLSDAQITEVFKRVSEDYRPFNINITTDEAVFINAPENQRIRVIVTPTSSWFTGVGGIAYVGSFTWGDDTPCFVFCDRLGPRSPKMVAECCSHESGHTLGLSHQAKYDAVCNLKATYNDGNGTGEIAWAPIMGNSYYRNMSGWNNGPTPYGCANVQDNLSIITSQNGFGYRTDDFADDFNTGAVISNPLNISIDGLISTNTDKDVFKVNLEKTSIFHVQAKPFSINDNNEGADLDVKVSLYDVNKNVIAVYNPTNTMSVTVDTILNAGVYFMMIEGTGNNFAADYGSLGSYSITGLPGVLPICNAALSGKAGKNQDDLSWNIACDEILRSVSLQKSMDGNNYTDVSAVDVTQKNLTISNHNNGDVFYRLKLVTYGDKIVYSNVLLLKKQGSADNRFIVSTLVTGNIMVMAPAAFQYRLLDINGNTLMKGNAAAGYNSINVTNKPSGIYVLQLFGEGYSQSQKITKQ